MNLSKRQYKIYLHLTTYLVITGLAFSSFPTLFVSFVRAQTDPATTTTEVTEETAEARTDTRTTREERIERRESSQIEETTTTEQVSLEITVTETSATSTETSTTSEPVVAEEPVVTESVVNEIPAESAATDTQTTAVGNIHDLQAAYFAKHKRYLQVLCDGTLPEYEDGTVESRLGQGIPSGYCVDVYLTPLSRGGEWGYVIRWEDNTYQYVEGYGPEKSERDFIIDKLAPIEGETATST